jgi:GTP pyrophosphokinase
MISIDQLTAKLSAYLPSEASIAQVQRVYRYSSELHGARKLPDGTPLIRRSLEVTAILADMRLDPVCLMAGLLYDVLPQKLCAAADLRAAVGDAVADLLEALAKLGRANFHGTEQSRADHMRQMILVSTRDLRVILILLADRLQWMRSLDALPAEEREAVARETLSIYSPIAHRLGIHYLLAELEDRAFMLLEPEAAQELQLAVDARLSARREHLDEISGAFRALLARNGMPAEVIGRTKHLYSIHQKLKRTQGSLDEIYDLEASRIIVGTVEECYRLLGLIHAEFTPLPGRFKDYIALPKANGYRSLHTTVFGRHGDLFEVQIRTREMHRAAELGVAAHFLYKDGARPDPRELAQLAWFRGLLDNLESGQSPAESMELLTRDLKPAEIFVFTPKGEVIKLPARATAIDYAYAIHTDIGHRCVGAKLDGRMIPIRSVLENGGVVEIITAHRAAPKKDWLKHAVTSKAITRIRVFLRQKERADAIRIGRERCLRESKRFGRKADELPNWPPFKEWMTQKGLHNAEEWFAAEGEGKVSLREVLEKLLPGGVPAMPVRVPKRRAAAVSPKAGSDKPRVVVSGISNLALRFARCCSPKPGDPLLGIVTRSQGVSIHHRDCGNVRRVRQNTGRLVEADWFGEGLSANAEGRGPGAEAPNADTPNIAAKRQGGGAEGRPGGRTIRLVVSAEKSGKGLAKVTRLLKFEGTPVEMAAVISSEGSREVQRLTVHVGDADQAARILHRLNAMAGVRAVRELESA